MRGQSRCTAILSFFDEPVEELAACVASLAGVADHLVAVDGAYMHFPEGQAASPVEQMRTIYDVARACRLGLTTLTPTTVWLGNEVEKRTATMRLAELSTLEDGWYLVVDGDCVVTHVAFDWFSQLERIRDEGWGAIEVAVRESRPMPTGATSGYGPVRLMYRALTGVVYGPTHWTVRAPDPETGDPICFWGDRRVETVVDAYDGTSLLKLDHRFNRTEERVVRSRQYYSRRERLGLERGPAPLVRKADGSLGPVTRH